MGFRYGTDKKPEERGYGRGLGRLVWTSGWRTLSEKNWIVSQYLRLRGTCSTLPFWCKSHMTDQQMTPPTILTVITRRLR